jgi:hypothetical protein
MIPGKYNIICPQGTTFNQQLIYSLNNVPINLTGFSARMQIREKHTTPHTQLNLTSSNGGLTLGEEDGTIIINVSATQTAAIHAKEYVYDLELVSSSNLVTRIIEGKFIVTPEVTR